MKFKFISLVYFAAFFILQSCTTNLENQASVTEAGMSGNIKSNEDFTLDRAALSDVEWFKTMYDAYEPKQNAISELRKNKENIRFVVFGGGWCSDTRKALPKFYKVVESANISADKIELYGVDHEKRSEKQKDSKLKSDEFGIDRVPEFIVFYNGKEVGRLNEKPKKSLEEDIVGLLK